MIQRIFNRLRRVRSLAWLLDNPLFVREVRRRMRGRLFSWSLIIYLALLGVVSCVIMFTTYPIDAGSATTRDLLQKVGKIGGTLFTGVKVLEAGLAILIAPMLTSGIATAEKEKDTFDFLRVTTLGPGTFVLGCLMTTASFLLLVFSCTLPILGLTFIFGGVSMKEILSFNLLIFLVALVVSAWGVFNSTNYKRSRYVHGSIVFIFFMFLMVGQFFVSRFIPGLGGTLFGTPTFTELGTVVGLAILFMGLLSLAASRRLYDPNNRLFNYKQFTVLYLLILGLVAGYAFTQFSGITATTYGSSSRVELVYSFYFVGWTFLCMSILFFSAGQIERGDEVWQIRVARPLFRKTLESHLLYIFYALVWIGGTAALIFASGESDTLIATCMTTLPILLAGLLTLLGVARLMSAVTANRNRASFGVIITIALLWGVVPLIGLMIQGVMESANRGRSLQGVARIAVNSLYDFSPVVALIRTEDSLGSVSMIGGCLIPLALGGLFALPTYLGSLKRRLVVVYD